MTERTCTFPDCDRTARARGWCTKHYARWRRLGDPLGVTHIYGDDLARFWSKVDKRGDDECWPWLGTIDRDGYGRFRLASPNRSEPAARTAYRLLVGPIPDGMVIDHVWDRGCRRRDCENPRHLEAVTNAENQHRSAPTRITHCPRGHEYTLDNTSTTSGTGRTCVICNRDRVRARRVRGARRNGAVAETD